MLVLASSVNTSQNTVSSNLYAQYRFVVFYFVFKSLLSTKSCSLCFQSFFHEEFLYHPIKESEDFILIQKLKCPEVEILHGKRFPV